MPTNHDALISAFLMKYYGSGSNVIGCELPLATITAKDRIGLVTTRIDGESYVIVDIGMRMLGPRELFLAQGFPESYVIDILVNGRTISKKDQVRMCGNSVSPNVAAALVSANAGATSAQSLLPAADDRGVQLNLFSQR